MTEGNMCLGANLYTYRGGEFGLPTIDFECLRAMCLVKFTRCPLQINTSGNPLRSGNGKLPYLQIGNEKFTGYRRIKAFLDREGYPIDKNLSSKGKQLSPLYANWVFTNLHAYFNYFLFGEPNNYEKTRALYAKRTMFPLNFYYPATYQKTAHEILLTMGGFDIHDKIENHDSDYLTLNAKKCVNTLSKKLAKKVWFFGDDFSEFDAIVYSYLSILYKIELPNNPLQTHIKACQNLVNFINRISKDIFKSESIGANKRLRGSGHSDPMLTPTERHFLESEKKTKIMAGIGALVAMGAYAAWRGLYQQLSNPRNEYNFIDDDDDFEDDDDGAET